MESRKLWNNYICRGVFYYLSMRTGFNILKKGNLIRLLFCFWCIIAACLNWTYFLLTKMIRLLFHCSANYSSDVRYRFWNILSKLTAVFMTNTIRYYIQYKDNLADFFQKFLQRRFIEITFWKFRIAKRRGGVALHNGCFTIAYIGSIVSSEGSWMQLRGRGPNPRTVILRCWTASFFMATSTSEYTLNAPFFGSTYYI